MGVSVGCPASSWSGDDEDRKLIAARRRDYNRLGFAVQAVKVRYLGMFLPDPIAVPPEFVAYLAEQLDIADPGCLDEYMVRRTTRFEHQAEIMAEYGLVAFADAEAELAVWIADQAWITGDGPKAIFGGAVAWCRARQVLLPGVTTLCPTSMERIGRCAIRPLPKTTDRADIASQPTNHSG